MTSMITQKAGLNIGENCSQFINIHYRISMSSASGFIRMKKKERELIRILFLYIFENRIKTVMK